MRHAWPEVTLREVCELRYGKALPKEKRTGGKYPVFGSNGEVGRHHASLTDGCTIIVGRKGSFGEVTYSDGPCWPIDTTYFVDESSTEADLRWLHYRMRALPLTRLNRAAAIPGLNRDDAYALRLLLPPIEEQRRIAAVLDAAEALRAKRSQVLARFDVLQRAIFMEMFGDPVTNPMGWRDDRVLADIADIRSGITKGRKTGATPLVEVPFLAVVNVQDGFITLDPLKTIRASDAEIEKFALRTGDILLTEGGDPDKLGRGAVWRGQVDPCVHQNHVFRVRVTADSTTPEFLSRLLGSAYGKRYFLRMAKQTTGIASINMGQLKAFPLLEPPVELQYEFLRRLECLADAQLICEESAGQIEALVASIQQRTFRGEL